MIAEENNGCLECLLFIWKAFFNKEKVSGIHYIDVALFQALFLGSLPFSKILAFCFECHYIEKWRTLAIGDN